MKIDQSKLDRQKACLKKWKDNNYIGTIEAATGFGKSYMGILAIQELRQRKQDPTIAIVVPTDYLSKKWTQDTNRFGIPNVTVKTINSWINDGAIKADMIIMDELHGYTGGDVWSTIFDFAEYDQLLGLTAKTRDKDKDNSIVNTHAPIVDRVPIDECLENNWISPFVIYNLGLDLNGRDRAIYDKMHKQFIKYFSTFEFSLNTMYACIGNDDVAKSVAKGLGWDPQIVKIHAMQANRIMQKRKQWLYSHDVIFDKSVEIIKAFPQKRIITFSQITSFADRLEDAIPNSVSYHSSIRTRVYKNWNDKLFKGTEVAVGAKNKYNKTVYRTKDGVNHTWNDLKSLYSEKLTRVSGDRHKEHALKSFIDGKSNVLHSATALNEGVDVPNINFSIKSSFNSSVLDSIQRTGRTARIDNDDPDKIAIEVNLYIKDTQSLRWLENSQRDTPSVKWIESINEII